MIYYIYVGDCLTWYCIKGIAPFGGYRYKGATPAGITYCRIPPCGFIVAGIKLITIIFMGNYIKGGPEEGRRPSLTANWTAPCDRVSG